MFADMIFDSPSKDLDNGFKAINLVFELLAIANSQTSLLPILIQADTVVSCTPAAAWFVAITFDLPCLAEFAAV